MNIESFVRGRALVFLQKNKDYGDSFADSIKVFPDAGRVRILDKVNRIKSLVRCEECEVEESIEDTILDLFNYAVMHYAIVEEESYYIEYLVKVMACWAHVPGVFLAYVNDILKVENTYLGFTETETLYVLNKLMQYIKRG